MPKNFSKKLFFTLIIQIFILISFFFYAAPIKAAGVNPTTPNWSWAMPNLQIDISGLKAKLAAATPTECGTDPITGNKQYCINWISMYIAELYKYAIGVVGIVAAVVLMIGGLIWLTAGGNQTRVGEAKSYIGASLTGLIIALSSYLILYQINPELVNLKPIKVTQVKGLPASQQLSLTELKCSWTAIPLTLVGASNPCVAVLQQSWWYDGGAAECEGESPSIRHLCCCPSMGGGWIFDGGIQNQISDASPQLNNLLNCMRNKLPVSVGRISSISDNNNRASQGFNNCDSCATGTQLTSCAHACQSCHYGGGAANLSKAVDFGDEQNKTLIMAAAQSCGAGYVLDEDNHIHVSDNSCPKN